MKRFALLMLTAKKALLTAASIGLASVNVANATCRFASSVNNGAETMTSSRFKSELRVGNSAGVSTSPSYRHSFNFTEVSDAAYNDCFLKEQSAFPKAVQIAPGSLAASSLVPSPDRTMRLSWTDGRNGPDVSYTLFVGPFPTDLVAVSTQTNRSYTLLNVSVGRDTFWRVKTTDIYGRSTWSERMYRFSIAPTAAPKLECAPNPFGTPRSTTDCLFAMDGSGEAQIQIYSLPHGDLVYHTQLPDLSMGPVLWTYDGRDDDGRKLLSGVYMLQIRKRGATESKERFRLLVVR